MFRGRHSGVSNPSLCPSFRGFELVRLLSLLFFVASEAYNSLEGVRSQFVVYSSNHPLRRWLTTWVSRITAVAGTSFTDSLDHD